MPSSRSHRRILTLLGVPVLLAPALLVGAAHGSAQDPEPPGRSSVRSITVFGDSMSDVGTYQAATGDPGNPGAFTVNPGNVWVENVAEHYGLTVTPTRSLTMDKDASAGATTQTGTASVLGGNGYAEGGARIAMLPSQSGVGNNQLVAPLADQVERYLASNGSFPADELVLIGGGSNDTFAQFSAVCWGLDNNGVGEGDTTTASATEAVAEAARAEVALVREMRAHGARRIVVAGAGDWSTNPFARYYLSSDYQSTGCSTAVPPAQVAAWTREFNRILTRGIAGLPGVSYLDVTRILTRAAEDPAAYGLVNVTDPACTNTTPTSSAVFCTEDTLVAPDAARTYLWSDAFHPTPRGHEILSDAALRLLARAPGGRPAAGR
ncbi:hypothetical protein FHP29_01295 [Nocardioides albidus]|uniref:SGNH/GDSL hydrolase family protein n=1 Tax=Nocardioides albidus TaxID=1517589 RepID=A0A5C4WMI1_9ACTN|nr:SGNH/GDSL hydrolase family protein [Nocardioides albidus]TNM49518.1 hypothetical protein FHP29_01295 [Nocardioides albidus]